MIHILDGMVGVFIGFIWGVLLQNLDMSRTNPIALISVILITSYSAAGLGLALGSLSLVTRNVMFVNNTAYFGLLTLSGAYIAIERLTAIDQHISYALPLKRGISAACAIVARTPFTDILPAIGMEFVIGLIFAMVGFLLFRTFELQAKIGEHWMCSNSVIESRSVVGKDTQRLKKRMP